MCENLKVKSDRGPCRATHAVDRDDGTILRFQVAWVYGLSLNCTVQIDTYKYDIAISSKCKGVRDHSIIFKYKLQHFDFSCIYICVKQFSRQNFIPAYNFNYLLEIISSLRHIIIGILWNLFQNLITLNFKVRH